MSREMTDAQEQVLTLIEAAKQKLFNEESLEDVEPAMSELLEHILRNESEREFIGQALLSLVEREPSTRKADAREIVEYCMHELRWPEMLQCASEARARAANPTDRWMWQDLIEAFSDDWKDAVMYDRYRR